MTASIYHASLRSLELEQLEVFACKLRAQLILATFTPGLALGIAGRRSDFLIWAGAAAIFGWAIAALANMRRKPRS